MEKITSLAYRLTGVEDRDGNEKKKKKRNVKSTVLSFIVILAVLAGLVLKCFTIDAYATLYCAYCGSEYHWNDSGTMIYHYYGINGSKPTSDCKMTVSGLSGYTEAQIAAAYPSYFLTSEPETEYEFNVYFALDEETSQYTAYNLDGSEYEGSTVLDPSDSGSAVDIIIAGQMIDTIFGNTDDEGTDDIMDPMTILGESCGIIVNGMEDVTATSFYKCMQAAGLALLAVFLCMDLTSMNTHQEFGRPTIEILLRPISRFVISAIVLLNIWTFLEALLFIAQYAFYVIDNGDLEIVTSAEMTGGARIKILIAAASNYVFGETTWKQQVSNGAIGVTLAMNFLIPWILTLVANIVALWIIFSRAIKLVMMSALAPLAMSGLYSDGPVSQSKGWHYIMLYAGNAFQVVTIPLIFYVVNALTSSYTTSLITSAGISGGSIVALANVGLFLAALKLVQVTAMVMSARMSQAVFGV